MARNKNKPLTEDQKERKRISQLKWSSKNREINSQKYKEYYQKNRERETARKKAYFNTPEGRAVVHKSMKKRREELPDSYIKDLIVTYCGSKGVKVNRDDITSEQVELQRKTIQIRRIIKSYKS